METNCKAIVSLLEQLFLICVTPELLQQDWIFLQTPFFTTDETMPHNAVSILKY